MSRNGFRGLLGFLKKTNKQADKAVQEVSWDAFSTLVQNSPVLLGNFRANWLVGLGVPVVGDPKNYRRDWSPGAVGTIQSFRVSNPGVSKGDAPKGLESTNGAPTKKAKLGQDVFIGNNLDYAEALEAGASPQTPAGILHVSAAQLKAKYVRRK